MVPVGMMQVALDDIIHMVAMGNRLVAAPWAVVVPLVMAFAGVARGAGGRIFCGHLNFVLLHTLGGLVVQVAIVQVIDMVPVLHRGVAAGFAVLVAVILTSHCDSPKKLQES